MNCYVVVGDTPRLSSTRAMLPVTSSKAGREDMDMPLITGAEKAKKRNFLACKVVSFNFINLVSANSFRVVCSPGQHRPYPLPYILASPHNGRTCLSHGAIIRSAIK